MCDLLARHTLQRETCDPSLPHHRLSSYCKSTKGLESRIQMPQHSHPATCPTSVVPLSSDGSLARNSHCTTAGLASMARWTQPSTAAQWGINLCWGASACASGRMTTERVVRLWKRLPKEVMESTSRLITLEPLSCKKVSTQEWKLQ